HAYFPHPVGGPQGYYIRERREGYYIRKFGTSTWLYRALDICAAQCVVHELCKTITLEVTP
ncbi:MAG: hypothetical protein ACXWQR_14205, partial [Ktedonobacterales bacterium]